MSPTPEARRRREAQARLEALAREDKWFLSAGDGVVWAPPFPRWLHLPGFWDEGHVYHYPMGPLFAVGLVGADGRSDPLVREGAHWRPDRLRIHWRSRAGLSFTEFRYLLPGGRFCSAWRTEDDRGWPNPVFRELNLVAFTAPPGDAVSEVEREGTGVRWLQRLADRREQVLDVEAHLASVVLPPRGRHGVPGDVGDLLAEAARNVCCGARRSEGPALPYWDLSPFVECWSEREEGRLGGALELKGVSPEGRAHMAVVLPLGELPARFGVGFVLTVEPGAPGYGDVLKKTRARGARQAEDDEEPHEGEAGLLPRRSESGWRNALAGYPRFLASHPHLERYFDYRIYGLHLNRIEGGVGRIPHPAIAEGIEYFHLPITYSAQCHMLESRWSEDPGPARGSLLNFLAAQREDGSLPGRLYVNHEVGEDFYHANWGDAVLAVDRLHPDPGFLAAAHDGLARYARWLMKERDPEGSGMITVVNHYETGQEYMSRYVAVDPDSDVHEWEPRLRLKGVDVTVYAYQLHRALEEMAVRLDRDEAEEWRDSAESIGRAILEEMWDAEAGIFSDVDAASGRRTGVKAAVCFYPLLTDLLDEDQVGGLLNHLTDPRGFATPFPVPSSSVDDALFSAEGLWKGKRHNCPWNGRVWPMASSHVVEGLLRQWQRGRRSAGPVAAGILEPFVRMMFHDGDPRRPNCYEHYNPFTGHPCLFRGIDDYQHSWVLDLLIRGVAGVEPGPGGIRVDPLPMGLESVSLRARLRGRDVSVRIDGEEVRADVDGRAVETTLGEAVEAAW